ISAFVKKKVSNHHGYGQKLESMMCMHSKVSEPRGSCYKMSKSSKPWSTAQQICELFSIGAHLVDIQNEEEHIFISSYLQTVNQIIMLWTGLNDLKVNMFDLLLFPLLKQIFLYQENFNMYNQIPVDLKLTIVG
uniref:C-type lectin domain-containing protein n=1 Tax=Chelydra serpentina TaxID=8475 RepID=A0A8C3XNJ8_CHESE